MRSKADRIGLGCAPLKRIHRGEGGNRIASCCRRWRPPSTF